MSAKIRAGLIVDFLHRYFFVQVHSSNPQDSHGPNIRLSKRGSSGDLRVRAMQAGHIAWGHSQVHLGKLLFQDAFQLMNCHVFQLLLRAGAASSGAATGAAGAAGAGAWDWFLGAAGALLAIPPPPIAFLRYIVTK